MESKMITKTIPFLLIFFSICNCHAFAEMKKVHAGVIVDMPSMKGKIIHKSISMAISDFYKIHGSYKTRLVLHTRDSKPEPFTAYSAGKSFNIAQEVGKRRFGHLLDNRRRLSSSNAKTTKGAKRSRKRLRIGVPFNSRFPELLNVQFDFQTNKTNASGFCVDVFKAAIEILPYKVNYEFIAFLNSSGRYDELVNQVYLKNYDAVIGDITITANRSLYVDFTLPFTDTGMGTVGLKQKGKSKWFFLKPLTLDLWLASAGFFLFTGFVVWVIERRRNDEFQGSPSQQIGTAFWFSFSTLVFAHRERLLSNLSRFVMMVWVFVVLVLTSSYTATLTSMLTVQQIELNSRNNYIGYGSNITTGSIINNFQNPQLQRLSSAEEYAEALSRGRDGGVSAIMDEMPYIKLFLAKYRKHYSMIGPVLPTSNGFGFAFPKNSKMVHDMSRAIATLREEGRLLKMENTMLNTQTVVTFGDTTNSVDPLDLETFQGLFLVSGFSSVLALAIFSIVVLRSKWHVLVKHYDHLIGQRFKSFKRYISNNLFTRIVRENNVVHPV